MVGKSLNFSEVFSDDISYMSNLGSFDSLVKIKSNLQYRDGDEKMEYINSKRKELRKKLAKSLYKIAIPLEDIENYLKGSLETYYKKRSISHCTIVEFSNLLPKGEHKHSRREGKLIVSLFDYVEGDEPNFSFDSLDAFRPLVQYIGWSILFLELKKLTYELKEGKIADQEKERPEIYSSMEESNEQLKNINPTDFYNGPKEISQPTELKELQEIKKVDQKKEPPLLDSLPSKTTIDYLFGEDLEKRRLLEYLKKTYKGEKGRTIAIMILALKEANKIFYNKRNVLYTALRFDFGNIGSDTSINNYMLDKNSGISKEQKEYKEKISEHAERIKNI